jgi:RND family efflux transporter MFP subunit
MEQAVKVNAVSKQEYDDAKAAYDVAVADEQIRKKALADTEIFARFDGVIARRYVENFENVVTKQPIVSLQNIDQVEVIVNVPEQHVAQYRRDVQNPIHATFDFLPGRKFDLKLKEFATEADPKTQTFQATLVMDNPPGVNIWPGMTASVSAEPRIATVTDSGQYAVPLGLVPVDEVGKYYVWRMVPKEGDVYEIQQAFVTVDRLSDNNAIISSGIRQGDMIAGAGVHQLKPGQRVKLASASAGPGGAG